MPDLIVALEFVPGNQVITCQVRLGSPIRVQLPRPLTDRTGATYTAFDIVVDEALDQPRGAGTAS